MPAATAGLALLSTHGEVDDACADEDNDGAVVAVCAILAAAALARTAPISADTAGLATGGMDAVICTMVTVGSHAAAVLPSAPVDAGVVAVFVLVVGQVQLELPCVSSITTSGGI